MEVRTMAGLRLGNRLRVARAERNLSQGELAALVGVTRQTISSVETGQYCPSALLALHLAVTLGKRFEDLFYLEEGPS
jgi:putative transcriptional regulator